MVMFDKIVERKTTPVAKTKVCSWLLESLNESRWPAKVAGYERQGKVDEGTKRGRKREKKKRKKEID